MLKLLTQQTVKNSTKLNKLITSDLSNETLNNPWKSAEAYHFYIYVKVNYIKINIKKL